MSFRPTRPWQVSSRRVWLDGRGLARLKWRFTANRLYFHTIYDVFINKYDKNPCITCNRGFLVNILRHKHSRASLSVREPPSADIKPCETSCLALKMCDSSRSSLYFCMKVWHLAPLCRFWLVVWWIYSDWSIEKEIMRLIIRRECCLVQKKDVQTQLSHQSETRHSSCRINHRRDVLRDNAVYQKDREGKKCVIMLTFIDFYKKLLVLRSNVSSQLPISRVMWGFQWANVEENDIKVVTFKPKEGFCLEFTGGKFNPAQHLEFSLDIDLPWQDGLAVDCILFGKDRVVMLELDHSNHDYKKPIDTLVGDQTGKESFVVEYTFVL